MLRPLPANDPGAPGLQLSQPVREKVGQRRKTEAQFGEFAEILQVSQPRTVDRAAVEDQAAQALQVFQVSQSSIGQLRRGQRQFALQDGDL